jgi:Clostripain family
MSQSAAPKAWAMLAYTVADDKGGGRNLDVSAKEELMAICDASDFAEVSIAAQVDFTHTRGVFRAVLTEAPPIREFEDVVPEHHPLWRAIEAKLKQSTLRLQMEREDLNAARGSVLQDFLTFGHAECPADRHVIFFYGHAHGPMGLFFDKDAGRRAPKTSLRLNDLAQSMACGPRPAALVAFRDCFMNTLETAYQCRHVAEFMIASQSLVPVSGIWPWASLMSALMPSASSADQALAFARSLGRFLDDEPNRAPFHDAPISLVNLGAADAIVPPLKDLVDALEEARGTTRQSAACAQALERARVGFPDERKDPGDPSLLDVPTLCEQLQTTGVAHVEDAAKRLGEVVGTRLVRWHHTQQQRHRGIALYYKPVTQKDKDHSCIYDEEFFEGDAASYRQLALSLDTGWDRIALNPLV